MQWEGFIQHKHLLSTYSVLVTVWGQQLWPRRHGPCLHRAYTLVRMTNNKLFTIKWNGYFWVLGSTKRGELHCSTASQEKASWGRQKGAEGICGPVLQRRGEQARGGQTTQMWVQKLRHDQLLMFRSQFHYLPLFHIGQLSHLEPNFQHLWWNGDDNSTIS